MPSVTSFRLDDVVLDSLRTYCTVHSVRQSRLVNEAISFYLETMHDQDGTLRGLIHDIVKKELNGLRKTG